MVIEEQVALAFLSVDDVELEYKFIKKKSTRSTIVLLHEGLGCVSMWKDFPERLAQETGLSVFAYSRSGYGGSSAIELPRPLNFHTKEALEVLPFVIEKMNIEEHFLLGHSDGASIGIIYAGSNLQPNLKGLILLAPHLIAEQKCVEQIEEAVALYRSGGLREQLEKYHGENTDCAFLGWSGAWVHPSFVDWNIEKYLHGINIPLLMFRGVDDPYNTNWHVEKIRQTVVSLVCHHELLECGHSPHVDAFDAVMESVANFTGIYQ